MGVIMKKTSFVLNFVEHITCAGLFILLLPTCVSLSPVNTGNSKNDSSSSCRIESDCCGLCSSSDDCINWLNCCDQDKNKEAKRLLNIDCVSIVDTEYLDTPTIDDIVTVVMCPNGTFCDRGTMVGGKTFVYISEACAQCNGDVEYNRINISAYGDNSVSSSKFGNVLSLTRAVTVLVERKFNELVSISYCNKDYTDENPIFGTRCKDSANEVTCENWYGVERVPHGAKYMFCHTCSNYRVIECKGNYQRRPSDVSQTTFSYILNSFDFAEIIGQRKMYDGKPRTDDDCPKGHVLSHSKVR